MFTRPDTIPILAAPWARRLHGAASAWRSAPGGVNGAKPPKRWGKCRENVGKMLGKWENARKTMGKIWETQLYVIMGKKLQKCGMGKLISCVGNIKTKKRCGNGVEEYWDNRKCQDKYRIGEKYGKNMLYLINSMHCFSCTCLSISQYMKVYHTWNHMCPYVVCTKLKDSRLWSWSKRHISGGWKTRKSHCPISWDARCPQTWCECCWKKKHEYYI